MKRFQDFDEVELVGSTLDIPIPIGARGSVVMTFPEHDDYLVEFYDRNGEVIDEATVRAENLRLINRYKPSKEAKDWLTACAS